MSSSVRVCGDSITGEREMWWNEPLWLETCARPIICTLLFCFNQWLTTLPSAREFPCPW